MKTDKLFYRIFLSQPDLIAELLPGVPPDCEFEYSAPVVKEIEIRLDGLLIPSSDDLSLPLVFLEAQMQTDVNFYGRYFAGIYLYLRQYKPNRPWKGLLILNRRSHDLGSEVPYQLQLDRQVQRLYLEDLRLLTELSPNLARLRLFFLPEEEVSMAARSILNNPPTQEEFQRRLDLVEAILVNKFPQLSFEEVLQMLDLKEVNLSETRFYQDVLQKGLEQGREQGLEQGVQREVDLVLRQLQRRCGVLEIDDRDLVRSLTITQLESLGDALLDFNGMADLQVWFKANLSTN
jgi:predicted transposase/invertase (TIGR01784 family)